MYIPHAQSFHGAALPEQEVPQRILGTRAAVFHLLGLKEAAKPSVPPQPAVPRAVTLVLKNPVSVPQREARTRAETVALCADHFIFTCQPT